MAFSVFVVLSNLVLIPIFWTMPFFRIQLYSFLALANLIVYAGVAVNFLHRIWNKPVQVSWTLQFIFFHAHLVLAFFLFRLVDVLIQAKF